MFNIRNFFKRRSQPSAKGLTLSVSRSYEEIESERILHGWFRSDDDVNRRLKQHMAPLRQLARSLSESNPYGVRFLDLRVINVIGDKGFRVQSRVANSDGSKDDFARKEIETGWAEWQKPENCTPAGTMHFNDIDRTCERSLARDGEVFLWVLPGFENESRFAIRPFEPEWIDEQLNATDLKNSANHIILGKEITPSGRCVAFWVRGTHPGSDNQMLQGKPYTRVPALSEYLNPTPGKMIAHRGGYILHQFDEKRPGQQRGFTEMAASIQALRNLERTEEAHSWLARLSSCVGFQEISQVADPTDGDPSLDGKSSTFEVEPGFVPKLGKGRKLEVISPPAPNTSLPDHVKSTLKGHGMSLGMSYPTFSGDLEGTSYSSGRTGAIAERDGFKIRQNFTINCRFRPIFHAWLRAQLQYKNLSIGTPEDIGTPGERRYRAAHIQGRRWDWVDPVKDSMGKKNDLAMRITSPQRVTADAGDDLEEIVDEWADYYEMLKGKGLPPTEFGQLDMDTLKILDPSLSEIGSGDESGESSSNNE